MSGCLAQKARRSGGWADKTAGWQALKKQSPLITQGANVTTQDCNLQIAWRPPGGGLKPDAEAERGQADNGVLQVRSQPMEAQPGQDADKQFLEHLIGKSSLVVDTVSLCVFADEWQLQTVMRDGA